MISEFFFPLWGDNDYVCEIVPPYSNKLLNPTSPFFKNRRLLILSYIPSGLQIWDCTDLGTVTEVLNLNFSGAEWKELEFDVGRVVYAALLSSSVNRSDSVRDKSDSFREDRPFLGIMYVILVFVPFMG